MNYILLLTTIFGQYITLSPAQTVVLHDGSPIIGKEVLSVTDKLTTEFLGIPFAESPVGKLRFRKPKPKTPWREPLLATEPPNSCVQSLDSHFGDFQGATMWNCDKLSEDCLYLNIYLPGKLNPTAKLAVVVWVFGGGFWSGCSTLEIYDGKIFSSEENVIIVSMNYRVSVFGFLYMGREEAPGNAGLWDQLTALKWIYKNIDLFGGDPKKITLFGESAGAAAVSMHMISPKSSPYFRRAIVQSGSASSPWAIEQREVAIARAVALYEDVGCGNASKDPQRWNLDEVLQCLLNASAEAIRNSEWDSVIEFADFPWVPVVDGDFLIEHPATTLKQGNFKPTELLAGSNFDEAIYFIVYQLHDIFPPKDFFLEKDFIANRSTWLRSISNLLPRAYLSSSLALASIIHEYEPADLPVKSIDWINSLDKMLGDLHFTCNVNEFALANSIHGGESYYYYFTHRSTQQRWPQWMGVVHGYEINFIFGEPLNTKMHKYTEEEKELSRRFMRYWANFARTGNPNENPDGSYTVDFWPPYTANSMEYLNLTIESDYREGAERTGTGPRRKQCSFWKKHLPRLLTALSDVSDQLIRWKQQMEIWENEYLVDWQLHFEQYKKYQTYRYSDSDPC